MVLRSLEMSGKRSRGSAARRGWRCLDWVIRPGCRVGLVWAETLHGPACQTRDVDVHYAGRVLAAIVTHPVEAVTRIDQRLQVRRYSADRHIDYGAVDDWEDRLHRQLGLSASCDLVDGFEAVQSSLRTVLPDYPKGHDADPALARAIWCIVGHSRPEQVVETGVARGISSRFVLEALERTGWGHLWSIDLPPLLAGFHGAVGAAVPAGLRDRWTYVRGPSRRQLPRLLKTIGPIDCFIQDSVGTPPTVLAELELGWSALRADGWLVVNAINRSEAFQIFAERYTPLRYIVASSGDEGNVGSRAPKAPGQFALVSKPSAGQPH